MGANYTAVISVAEGVYLRPATVADAPALFHLLDSQRPYLRAWLPFIDQSQEVRDTEQFLKSISHPKNTSEEAFVVVFEHQVVGLIAFKEIDFLNQKLEIGYWLSQLAQGKGIMRRACQALIKQAFVVYGFNRVQVKVSVGNHKSSAIPKKLGFVYEGTQRAGEFLNGRFHDLEVYSLLKQEWLAQQ